MLVPAVGAQSLEKNHRSAGEHLKGSTKELQPASHLHRGPNLNAFMLMHAAQEINRRSLRHEHACRVMISVASGRCGGMAPMTGALEWKDTGFLGRAARGHEEGVLPSVSMTSWSAQSSTWEWMSSQPRVYGVWNKGRAGPNGIIVGVC